MRPIHYSYILLVFAVILFGCVPHVSPIPPTTTETQLPSLTPIPPTTTSTPTSTSRPALTATLTPPATLEPSQAKETIRTLLQEPIDCAAPCFLGITPGKTTAGEVKNILLQLGLHKPGSAQISYAFENGLELSVGFKFRNTIVENLLVGIIAEPQKAGVPRTWLAYSPEALINRYGPPSKVNFNVDRGEFPSYGMVMYFGEKDLIVEYYSYDLGAKLQVCPPTDQMSSVRLWMGPDPQYPPLEEVPLEKATSMTMEEFSELMTGSPSRACFNLKEEVFP